MKIKATIVLTADIDLGDLSVEELQHLTEEQLNSGELLLDDLMELADKLEIKCETLED